MKKFNGYFSTTEGTIFFDRLRNQMGVIIGGEILWYEKEI